MEKNIKYLFIITGIIVVGAMGYSFYETIIAKETIVLSGASCDPETEGPCYIWVCEPSWWDECSGDPEEDIWTYKMIQKRAADMPACMPEVQLEQVGGFLTKVVSVDEPCPEQECTEGDPSCGIIYCDPETDGADACFDGSLWDDYVAALYDGVAGACADKIGDYKGDPDYCTMLDEMDSAASDESATQEEESTDAVEGTEGSMVEDEIIEE